MSEHNPNLNRENIRRLREFILSIPDSKFNMTQWMREREEYPTSLTNDQVVHSCNTAGCIGGWTQALFEDPTERFDSCLNGIEIGRKYLGITEDECHELFYPTFDGKDFLKVWEGINKQNAADVLDRLDKVGYVDWKGVVASHNI